MFPTRDYDAYALNDINPDLGLYNHPQAAAGQSSWRGSSAVRGRKHNHKTAYYRSAPSSTNQAEAGSERPSYSCF